jgi:hypothetical protein
MICEKCKTQYVDEHACPTKFKVGVDFKGLRAVAEAATATDEMFEDFMKLKELLAKQNEATIAMVKGKEKPRGRRARMTEEAVEGMEVRGNIEDGTAYIGT